MAATVKEGQWLSIKQESVSCWYFLREYFDQKFDRKIGQRLVLGI